MRFAPDCCFPATLLGLNIHLRTQASETLILSHQSWSAQSNDTDNNEIIDRCQNFIKIFVIREMKQGFTIRALSSWTLYKQLFVECLI
jgi:hypothetical protein